MANFNEEILGAFDGDRGFRPKGSSSLAYQEELSRKMIGAIIDQDKAACERYVELGCDPFYSVMKLSMSPDGEGHVHDYDEDEFSPMECLFVAADRPFFEFFVGVCERKLGDVFRNALDADFTDAANGARKNTLCKILAEQERTDLLAPLARLNFFDKETVKKTFAHALKYDGLDLVEALCKVPAFEKALLGDLSAVEGLVSTLFTHYSRGWYYDNEKRKTEAVATRFPKIVDKMKKDDKVYAKLGGLAGSIRHRNPNPGAELLVFMAKNFKLDIDHRFESAVAGETTTLREAFKLPPEAMAKVEEELVALSLPEASRPASGPCRI